MCAWAYSTVTVATKPSFSRMLGIMRVRNRTGSVAIARNASCHAIVTARKP
jgi:hypothetical protein